MAAVLYVFRTLVQDSIPLNEGCLKPLNIILPEGSMINPRCVNSLLSKPFPSEQTLCIPPVSVVDFPSDCQIVVWILATQLL